MNFTAYKLKFKLSVHFGSSTLDSCEYVFHSDSMFSALCIEALNYSKDSLNKLVQLFSENRLCISDCMPYINETLFLPKPCCYIEAKNDTKIQSSVVKKQNKSLKYISAENYHKYFNNTLEPLTELEKISGLGKAQMRTLATINEEKTTPYSLATYKYNENCGLYIIVGYEDFDDLCFIEDLLTGLSYSGIGGKRSSGLGKFELDNINKLPKAFEIMLNKISGKSILISTALPNDDELEFALKNAQYSVIKRSGFVSSTTYSSSFLRRKDIYMFSAGSYFSNRFNGSVRDLSQKDSHSVYRCTKPMWIGVWLWKVHWKAIRCF